MNFYDASGENPMVVQYNSDIWVVEGVNETARQVHLRNVRSNKACSACIACVKSVDHRALIQSAVANIAAKEASSSLILVSGFTPEQMREAQDRCSIIVRELSGKITAQEAAKQCGLSRPCSREMNDFTMIRADVNYRRLRPADVIAKNQVTLDFLGRELSKPFEGRTFVVTHHCPIREVAGGEYDGHVSAAYYNQWHRLLEQADYWAFGHTHHSVDTVLGGCRLLSNQRGYPGEKCGFDPYKVIEIV